MREGMVAMMIVVPETVEKKHITIANKIISRNGERQYTETFIPSLEDENLKDMPTSVGDYFIGYIPKSWLVPFDGEGDK